jgi:hypothetical protein
MAVKVVHLLIERAVGKHLIPREVKVLAIVTDPINLEANLASELNKRVDTTKKSRRAASFENNHVGIDEQGALAEDVGVEIAVGNAGENGAAGTSADPVQVGSGKGPETPAVDGVGSTGVGGRVAERGLVVGEIAFKSGNFAKDDLCLK